MLSFFKWLYFDLDEWVKCCCTYPYGLVVFSDYQSGVSQKKYEALGAYNFI
jgi:hypothetical protein